MKKMLLAAILLVHTCCIMAQAKDTGNNITLHTGKGDIYGTLLQPAGDKKVPVVLIIAGSGPTDRNGNNNMGLQTNTYQLLAAALQANGIASLRYDKRGIGASAAAMKSESELSFEDMVNDAAGFIKLLQADKRFSKVIVAGHSEGSLIGMIAANREKAQAFISIAGAGERADIIIGKQLQLRAPTMAPQAKLLMDSLRQGHLVEAPGGMLQALFRKSVQPYMISWLKYDPQAEIKKLKIPVLIVQGNTDIQISTNDATLLKQANPAATLKEIDQMNHVLKQSTAGVTANMATYGNPALPLKPELISVLTPFILQQ